MLVSENGKLYIVYEECEHNKTCELHKGDDKFSSCQNLGGGTPHPGKFYCKAKSNYPHVKAVAKWVLCGEDD